MAAEFTRRAVGKRHSPSQAPPRVSPPRRALGLALVLACCTSLRVGSSSMAVLGAGVLNDPSNKTLRFDMLKFGLEEFCKEMTRRGAPLKLSDDQPVLGRFFAEGCQSQVLEQETRQSFVVQFSGRGYGYTNLTGRLGFQAAGLVEYAPDFQMHEGALYVYFRPKKVDATAFQLLLLESPLASAAGAMMQIDPAKLGQEIVAGQLRRGFTVVRYDSTGQTDFGLGIIPIGQKPFMPFTVQNSERLTLANERTEIQGGQQDFVGGFRVDEEGQSLSLTLSLDGTSEVDVALIAAALGQPMLQRFITTGGPAPLTTSPLLSATVRQGARFQGSVLVPPGSYYLLIDHSPAFGNAAPPPAGGSAATVDYVVQLGD